MATVAAESGRSPAERPPEQWRASAFGLDLRGAFAAPGLDGGAESGGRSVSLELTREADLERAWRGEGATRISTQKWADGRVAMTIDERAGVGYRVFGDGFGVYLLSSDGARIRCSAPATEAWRWQRFLIGQVLPLAAVLRGLEVFHASAVALAEGAVALVGPSRAGKTSVAVNLLLRGAAFLTDDVLALEQMAQTVQAHPGAAVASVRHEELDSLAAAKRARLGEVLGDDGEAARIVVPRAERALPLTAMYFLEHADATGDVAFERIPGDPRLLLASSFNFVLQSPERLANQLDVCARVAAGAAMFRVSVPASTGAAELAEAIEVHAPEAGA